MKKIELPYFNERPAKIDAIIIHCLAHDIQGALASFDTHQVSAHYLIDENGKIYQFVDDDKRAWHAGLSHWQGQDDLNNTSIGIELCSSSFGQKFYPIKQMKALIRLCTRLKRKYHIKKERVLGHSDIAPERKADPGKAFDWRYLARHNLGLWYKLQNAGKIKENDEKILLKAIGYNTSDFKAAKCAFVRHYMGSVVSDEQIDNLLKKPSQTPFNVDDKKFLTVLKAVTYSFKKD